MATNVIKIKKRLYRSTSQYFPLPGEDNFGKSQSVPDLSHPIRELLARHANGLKDNVQLEGNYSGDLPDYRGLEPHELDKLMYETQQQVKDLQAQKERNTLALQNALRKTRSEEQAEMIRKATEEFNSKKTE